MEHHIFYFCVVYGRVNLCQVFIGVCVPTGEISPWFLPQLWLLLGQEVVWLSLTIVTGTLRGNLLIGIPVIVTAGGVAFHFWEISFQLNSWFYGT